MKKFCTLFAVTLLLLWASLAFGQRDGIPSFGAADTHDFDVVDLSTLTPSFNFPGISKSQGMMPGSIAMESPQGCHIAGTGSATQWTCGAGLGSAVLAPFYAIPQEMLGMSLVYTSTTGGGCTNFFVSALVGADGVSLYPFPSGTQVNYPPSCTNNSATVSTTDGTGYTATFKATTGSFVALESATSSSGWSANYLPSGFNGTVLTDPFGNTLTYDSTHDTFTDTLGAVTTFTGAISIPTKYTYTDTSGTSRSITFTSGTASTFQPTGASSCAMTASGQAVTPITNINYPDGTSFAIGWQTNNSGLSGLIDSITLRTGGTITYTYGTPEQVCNVWAYTSLSRATADGTTNYSASTTSGTTTTTVLDPGKNKTVYTFIGGSGTTIPGGYLSTVYRYQNTGTVASPSYTGGLISNTSYCYNTSCSAVPTPPVTTYEIKEYVGTGSTFMSDETKTFDSTYGLVLTDAKTDEINGQTITTTYVYGTYSSGSCSAITNTAVVDHPCTITTKNGSTWLSGSTYTYNSNGALTSSSACLNSTCSSALTTNYTRNSTGTPATVTLPNSQVITNTFGSCNSLLLTDSTTTVNSVAIDNKTTWDSSCNGLAIDTTDANSNEDDTTYDSMNRIHTYTDRLENVTTYDYGTPTLDHVKITDPLNVVSYQYNDGLGRPTNTQICQTTGCSNLDTSSKSYAWNGTNFETKTYVPCVQTVLNTACTTVALTADNNPIAGPQKTTDANSGTLTFAVNSKDFSVTAGPAPSQENTKVVQTEIDGFGRTTSTCALTSSGYDGRVSCGQTMGNSGTLTSSTFTYGTGSYEVDTVRGSQTHKHVVDSLGRTTSTTTPEAGTVTAYYDSIPTGCYQNGLNQSGFLTATKNAAGTYTCPGYDAIGRTNYVISSTHCKRFIYDATANSWQSSPPSGFPSSGANLIGRLVEAATDDCTFPPTGTHLLTDEWFVYDKDGRQTDAFQYTKTGGTYYHTTAAYDADGTVTSVGGFPGWTSALTYVTDGEDRWNTASWESNTLINGVTYDAASRPTTVTVGTLGDKDTFAYDNVGNVTQEQYFVGSNNRKEVLTWNPIGSLATSAITDGFNSSNTQTCTFGTSSVEGYDDVGRLLSDNCGTVWAQTFTYDQYDNLKQSGSSSYSPTYTASNNQDSFATYDTNGNITKDANSNTYTYDGFEQMATINSGSTILYDAFGRQVANPSGNATETIYTPNGWKAMYYSSASKIREAYIPLPGGILLDSDGTAAYVQHPNWLGSTPVMSGATNGTVYNDRSYSPFGQIYNNTSTDIPYVFSGLGSSLLGLTLWDAPARERGVASARWLSPDPAHAGWNAYAYPTDPNTQTDPSGLDPQEKPGPQQPDTPTPNIFIPTPCMEEGPPCMLVRQRVVDPQAIKEDQELNNQLTAWMHGAGPAMASAFFKFYPKMTPEQIAFNSKQIGPATQHLYKLQRELEFHKEAIINLRKSYASQRHLLTDAEAQEFHNQRVAAIDEYNNLQKVTSELEADIQRATLDRIFGSGATDIDTEESISLLFLGERVLPGPSPLENGIDAVRNGIIGGAGWLLNALGDSSYNAHK